MSVLLIVFGVALLALGFWAHLRVWAKAKASLSWPTVPGTITAATLQARESGTSETGTSKFLVFCADYAYAVNGVAHACHWECGDKKRFAELQTKYAAGSTVAVLYDPAKPRNAALEPLKNSMSSIALPAFIVGAVAIIAGLVAA